MPIHDAGIIGGDTIYYATAPAPSLIFSYSLPFIEDLMKYFLASSYEIQDLGSNGILN